MSTIKVATNFNIDLEFTAAPFHKRLIAWALDLLLQVLYLVLAFRLLNSYTSRLEYSSDSAYNLWAIGLLIILPFLVYHISCEILMNGQSVGKRIMEIKVVSENGCRPGMSQLVIRWLIRTSDYMLLIIILYGPSSILSGYSFISAIGGSILLLFTDVVLVNATRKNQRLGDILAHTIIISTKQNAAIEETVFLQVAEQYVPQFPQVMQLHDRDINSLKGILDTAKKRHDYQLADRASEKIKTHLNIQTSMSPFDFLEVLLKDYNYLASR